MRGLTVLSMLLLMLASSPGVSLASEGVALAKVGVGKPYNLPTRHMGSYGCGGEVYDCKTTPMPNVLLSAANQCIRTYAYYGDLSLERTKRSMGGFKMCAYSSKTYSIDEKTYSWPVCCFVPVQDQPGKCSVTCHNFSAKE